MFQDVVSELGTQTQRLVSISAYVSEVDARAFSWHVDKWDNIIVQLRGRKAFDLEDDASFELTAGYVLFLPQDVEHRPRTLDHSIHLSVAIFQRRLTSG